MTRGAWTRVRSWSVMGLGAAVAGAAAACGSASAPAEEPAVPPNVAKAKSSFDPCASEPPPEKAYQGLARDAQAREAALVRRLEVQMPDRGQIEQ